MVVPLEMNLASYRVVEVEVPSGEVRALTDPAETSLRIAGGDWSPSADGNRIDFVSAEDHKLCLIELLR